MSGLLTSALAVDGIFLASPPAYAASQSLTHESPFNPQGVVGPFPDEGEVCKEKPEDQIRRRGQEQADHGHSEVPSRNQVVEMVGHLESIGNRASAGKGSRPTGPWWWLNTDFSHEFRWADDSRKARSG